MERKRPSLGAACALVVAILITQVVTLVPSARAGLDVRARLVLELSDEVSHPTQSFEAFDTKKLNVIDLTGDGIPELIAKNDNNWVYVFDTRTGGILAEFRENVWRPWPYRELGGVAVGDVNGNGRIDLVTASSAGFVTVHELDLSKSTPQALHFDRLWTRHLAPTDAEPDFVAKNPWARNLSSAYDGAPYLADVDGDGADEIFLQSDNVVGHYALDGSGDLLWAHLWDDGNGNPWVADLDGDGASEAVYATDSGRIWVYDARSGDVKWTFNAQDHGAVPASIPVPPGIIDITGDGRFEIVFGARQAIEDPDDPEWHLKQHLNLFALAADGNLVWKRVFDWANPLIYMLPAAHDVDGDGVDDAVFVDWNTIGHKPGDWEPTGRPNLFALNGAGDLLFRTETRGYWGNKDIAIADVDGDGVQEILVNEGVGDVDGIGVFNMGGERVAGIPLNGWAASRGPIIADLRGDGSARLIVPVVMDRAEPNYRELDVGYRAGKILIYDLGVAHDAAWGGNILFNERLDHVYGGGNAESRVPRVRVTQSPGDGFGVRVDTGLMVTGVSARASGSENWIPLVNESGEWRGHIDADVVRLRITLADGSTVLRSVTRLPIPPPPDADGDGRDDGPDGARAELNRTPATGVAAVVALASAVALMKSRRRRA